MKKKNGFVSMSLVYAFFIVFVALMLSLLSNYASNRILANRVNQDIIKNINNDNVGLCNYQKGDTVISRVSNGLNVKKNEIFDNYSQLLIGKIKLNCNGYYRIELAGSDGGNHLENGSIIHYGGRASYSKAILKLSATSLLYYSIGHDSSIKYYYNYEYIEPLKATGGTDATVDVNGIDGSSTILLNNFIYEQYSDIISRPYGILNITYLGTDLS